VVVLDSAPVVIRIDVSSAAPRTNDILVLSPVATDVDGDVLYWSYTVWVNGIVRICCAGGIPLRMNLAYPGWGDHGDRIDIQAQAGDGLLGSAVATRTLFVANSAPDVAVSLNTRTPSLRDILVAAASGSDADGDAVTFTYTWWQNKKTLRTTTTSATTDSFDLAGNFNNGDAISVVVTANDGFATSLPATDTATVTANKNR